MYPDRIKIALISLLALALLGACGSGTRQVRGESPLISLDHLTRSEQEVVLGLGLRNVNDRPLELEYVQLILRLEDQILLETETATGIDVSARGREVLRITGPAQAAGLEILDRLSPGGVTAHPDGPLSRASWTMEVNLTNARGRTERIESSGFLHPAPGQPNRFR